MHNLFSVRCACLNYRDLAWSNDGSRSSLYIWTFSHVAAFLAVPWTLSFDDRLAESLHKQPIITIQFKALRRYIWYVNSSVSLLPEKVHGDLLWVGWIDAKASGILLTGIRTGVSELRAVFSLCVATNGSRETV